MHLILLSLMVILPYLAIAVTGWVMGWSYAIWSIAPMVVILIIGGMQLVRSGSPWWAGATLAGLLLAYLGGILLPVWTGLIVAGILGAVAMGEATRHQRNLRRRIDEIS